MNAASRRPVRVAIAIGAALFACLLAGAQSPAKPHTGNGAPDVQLTLVATFDNVTYVDNPPGDKNLLLVCTRTGSIRVVRNGQVLTRPFLKLEVGEADDQGLLSMAFAPDYRQSRRFYVYATGVDGNNRVIEFRTKRHDPARALRSSARTVMVVPHPSDNTFHNGGQLQFGPDGHLYVSVGDGTGGDGTTSHAIAQDINSPLGKLLRINPLPTKSGKEHSSPGGNPFVGRPGLNEIYALGFRNPFRFSFDSVSGAIAISDVGQLEREEIDFRKRGQARGVNFGWPRWEGTLSFPPFEDMDVPGAVFPIREYAHDGGRCAVIAGYVVHDRRLPELYGRLIYGDLCDGTLRSLIPHQAGATDDKIIGGLDPVSALWSFGQGRGGRIYVATNDSVLRLDPL